MKKTDPPIFEIVDDDFGFREAPKANTRMRRLRAVAWLLDYAFSIGGKRFGVEPLIGLIPGIGDWIGGMLSLYIVYEAARLGVPWRIIARMGVNVFLETVVGTVPVAGDIFDFVWKANLRNLRLAERYCPVMPSERPISRILLLIFLAAFLLLIGTVTLGVLLGLGLWHLFSRHA